MLVSVEWVLPLNTHPPIIGAENTLDTVRHPVQSSKTTILDALSQVVDHQAAVMPLVTGQRARAKRPWESAAQVRRRTQSQR